MKNQSDASYILRIVFTDNSYRDVRDISNYGYDGDLFVFEKDDCRHFLPKEHVKYFGLKSAWGA